MPWWGWLVIGLAGSLIGAFQSYPRAFGVATTNFLRKKFGKFGGELIEDKFIERPVQAFLDGLNYDNGGQDEKQGNAPILCACFFSFLLSERFI